MFFRLRLLTLLFATLLVSVTPPVSECLIVHSGVSSNSCNDGRTLAYLYRVVVVMAVSVIRRMDIVELMVAVLHHSGVEGSAALGQAALLLPSVLAVLLVAAIIHDVWRLCNCKGTRSVTS